MATTDSPRGIDGKQPWEELDYDFDFTKRLTAVSDTLDSATVTCEDLSITLLATEVDTMRVKQWVSGGTTGVKYKLTCRAITAGGRKLEKEMYVPVKER